MPNTVDEIDESDVNRTDRGGRTQLMDALCPVWRPGTPKETIDENRRAVVQRLLDLGADPARADGRGWTALHFAAQEGLVEIAQWLIDKGATVDAQDKQGNAPLATAVMNSTGEGTMIRLLLKHGANPRLKNRHGNSPLDTAKLIANYDLVGFFE